jgi:hypothetical protein
MSTKGGRVVRRRSRIIARLATGPQEVQDGQRTDMKGGLPASRRRKFSRGLRQLYAGG